MAKKTFIVHQTIVGWALYILLKFMKSLIGHLTLTIRNVRRFSWTLLLGSITSLNANALVARYHLATGHQHWFRNQELSWINYIVSRHQSWNISWKKQGKSEGFDSCNRPSNLKLDSNRQFFRLCDREIWWMTLQKYRTPLLCNFKLCASFRSHWWIQTWVTVRKRPIWVKLEDF